MLEERGVAEALGVNYLRDVDWRRDHSDGPACDAFVLRLVQLVDLNAPDYSGETALACCAQRGAADLARLMIEKGGADPSVRGPNGSPLMIAARAGHGEMVEMLAALAPAEDLEELGPDGESLFFAACSSGDCRSIRALAGAGSPTAVCVGGFRRGWTPLMAAADGFRRQEACMEALRGSDPWGRGADATSLSKSLGHGVTALGVNMGWDGACAKMLCEAMEACAPSSFEHLAELSYARGMAARGVLDDENPIPVGVLNGLTSLVSSLVERESLKAASSGLGRPSKRGPGKGRI
jgi:hypothetical protein